MFRYDAFGGVISSAFEFPELDRTSTKDPTWTVRRGDRLRVVSRLDLVGEEWGAGYRTRLFTAEGRVRLDAGALGLFEIESGGAAITWYKRTHDCVDCARRWLLGRVLALAIDAAGGLCLEAPCVEIGGTAIAFLRPPSRETTDMLPQLLSAGATMVADEMLRVDGSTAGEAAVLPGVQRRRIHQEMPGFELEESSLSPIRRSARHVTVSSTVPASVVPRLPLGALYVIDLETDGGSRETTRLQIEGHRALDAIVRSAMVGSLLGSMKEEVLDSAGRLAERVPVYALHLSKDRLPEACGRLLEWHNGAEKTAGESDEGKEISRVA
jgi:hypothetical protein